MSTEATAAASSFDAAALRVQQRIVLRRWLATLSATLWWAAGAIALAALLRTGVWLPVLLAAAWTAAAFFWARHHTPGKYESLALWDQVKDRFEAFAAAWWFASQEHTTPAGQRHVTAQQELLPAALMTLANDLPLPRDRRLWIAPGLTVLAIAFNLWQPVDRTDVPMNDAMQSAAKEEAKRLVAEDWQKKKVAGLTEAEKEALDKLKQDVTSAAKDLEKGNASSARDVLSNLEQRARDAEKLAERLGAGSELWASEKMIEAMRKHADTADLGDAAASRQASQTSKAANDLATTLKSPQLTADAKDRLSETLRDIAGEADPKDRERTVGSHVIKASDHLEEQQVMAAAQEFEELAKKLRDTAQREEARKQLEQLAQQLRDAGSRIAGQQAGGMQQMAGAAQTGQMQKAQGSMASQSPESLAQSATGAQQALLPPGLNQQQQQGQMSQQQLQSNPSAVSQQQNGAGQGQQQQGQNAQAGQKRPTLFAPDPRAKPGEQPGTMIMGQNPPSGPDAQSVAMSMPGGNQAGNAKAKLDAPPTSPSTQTKQSSVVNAASGSDGNSTTRSIEGGIRTESATRTSQQMAVDLIHEQEAALDDTALPPARREQVRRYFQELRKRFEPETK